LIYKKLNKQFSVSDQIDVDDIDELVAHGVQIIICNRPDNEEPNQPLFESIKKAAEAQSIETHLLDFSSYHIKDKHRDQLVPFINSNKKIHLYCRTGSRSTRLWRSVIHLSMNKPE